MNWAQWLFEYKMLKRQEREHIEFASTLMISGTNAFRETLIGVLGLNALRHDPKAAKAAAKEEAEAKAKGESLEYDGTPFVPAVFAGFANPEVVRLCVEEKDKEAQEDTAGKDANFDEWSEGLMRHLTGKAEPGESEAALGDMVPLVDALDSDRYDKNALWNSLEMQEQIQRLGIGVRDAAAGPVAHIKKTVKGISEDEGGSLTDADDAREEAANYAREMKKFKRALAEQHEQDPNA